METTQPRLQYDVCSFCGSDASGERAQDTVRHLFLSELSPARASRYGSALPPTICDKCVLHFAKELSRLGIPPFCICGGLISGVRHAHEHSTICPSYRE